MRVFCLADTHLGFDDAAHPRIERRRRGVDFYTNFQAILDAAVEEKIDALIHGGDLFFRSKIPRHVMAKVYNPMLKVLEAGIDIFLVPGNHERSKFPPSPLFKHPRMHVFDRPRTFTIRDGTGEVHIGGFPNERENISAKFSELINASGLLKPAEGTKILLMHQAIEGAVVGVQNFKFRSDAQTLSMDQLALGLDLILAGHIHRYQELTARDGTPVIYPGSIERTSFAERSEEKGFLHIDIQGERINWSFRKLPTRPMLRIRLDPRWTSREDILHGLKRQFAGINPNAIIQVQVEHAWQVRMTGIRDIRTIAPPSQNIELTVPRNLRRESR